MSRKLSGIIPPMVTPLLDKDRLDIESLKIVINHMLEGGIHALFILGTTGEGPSLSNQLKRELIQESISIVENRVPVLVGVSDASTIETINLAHYAKELGANAIVIAPPFYNPITQDELLQYFELVSAEIDLPIVLYNMPSHTKVDISYDVIVAMAKNKNIIGVKDSSGDLSYFQTILSSTDRDDFCFLTGPEILLAESMKMGGDGGVCGGANLYPQLFVELYKACVEGNSERIEQLTLVSRAIQSKLYSLGNYGSGFLTNLKSAMAIKGYCKNILAPPYFAKDENESAEVSKALVGLEATYPILKN